MSCDCEKLKEKIKDLERDNAILRHQLHKYADELEMRQNTAWMVEELIRRCPRRESNLAELVAYTKPETVVDWEEIEITDNRPLQRIQLEEIRVCFYFNRFSK
ncbi:MAG: hypothetical protein IJW08_06010 [Lentisphaeria bacterium]|nr:hypothetical protein [Lentisphaeria bacterium]